MFQTANPLRQHARNPNLDANVPNLTESEIRLKKANRISSIAIKVSICLLLLVLLVTICLTLYTKLIELINQKHEYPLPQCPTVQPVDFGTHQHVDEVITRETIIHKKEDPITHKETVTLTETTTTTDYVPHTTDYVPHTPDGLHSGGADNTYIYAGGSHSCDECLDYRQVWAITEDNSRNAETFIDGKLSRVLKENLGHEGEEVVLEIENFEHIVAGIPQLRQKIDDIITLNRTFGQHFGEYKIFAKTLQDLKDSLDNKNQNMRDVSGQIKILLIAAGDLKDQKLRYELEQLNNQKKIDANNRDLQVHKEEHETELARLRRSITEVFKRMKLYDDAGLDALINSKLQIIEAKNRGMAFCLTNITLLEREIDDLRFKFEQKTHLITNLDLKLGEWSWVAHVLVTIKKFEDVRLQVIDLKDKQLKSGRENIERVVGSLKSREALLQSELLKITAGDLKEVNEAYDDILQQEAAMGATFSEIVLNTATHTGRIAVLKYYIEKEKSLLRVWDREQINTFNVSQYEINNVTQTIFNLKQSVEGKTGEYERLIILKAEAERALQVIRAQIIELEKLRSNCRLIIDNGKGVISVEELDLSNLYRAKEKIAEIRSDIVREDKDFKRKQLHLENENQRLGELAIRLRENIAKAKNDLDNKLETLKRLILQLNELIARDPHPEHYQKKIIDYKNKIRETNRVYQELLELTDQIRKAIC